MSDDPLLQPYRLKHLTFRNRLLSTAHEPAYTEEGMPKGRYRLYHAEKAKGGIALTMIGGSAVVAPDSPQAFGNILLYRDEVVRWLGELADDVHSHGAAVMIQITHLGRRTTWGKADWLPVLAPSSVREPAHRASPKAMEDWDIARVVADYADAAERVKAAGLDGIEVEAYGHLLDQFWSPLTNKRDDGYGGSLDNRLRFGLEVLGAIRKRVGPDFVVGVRAVADEDQEGGITREEGLGIAGRLQASGLIDFVNVIRGHIDTEEGLSHVIPNMGARSAPHLDFAGEVRAATRLPTFHAARIQDVATARHAIASGKLDMVGMTRAHLADPHIARKIAEGREHTIRPCVGMGYCIDSIYSGQAVCIHNAATGREAGVPHVAPRSPGPRRRVVVVGAGPGGLEAARVAGERGHEVLVLEAASQPGGQVRLAAALKRRREIMGIVDWRMSECERHGVAFRFDTYAEAGDVLAEDPDVVVVATGGLPDTGFLDAGAELATTGWDLLSGAVRPAASVLVYDEDGAHPGMTAAEFAAGTAAALQVVTPERTLAPDVGGTSFPAYFKALSVAGAEVTLNLRLRSLERRGNRIVARFFDDYGRRWIEKEADQVVVEHGTVPLDELYLALKPGSANLGEVDHAALLDGRPQGVVRNPEGRYRLFRVGDAVAGRNIHAAVYDAMRLMKDL
ncbi:N-methylproline demethylase [Lichenibacterium minor]|uniref:N-methylproline demethylase n=1 Tax=Lichenibacterium minor TaxID=2316528 RepID=A0A4Q2U7B4_9HYPH|nr:NADH:flavin oxidoreductase [Lichenibacterium minor]RYC30765.1 N-methylproline demethylase [Lichenibacterium minor]